MGPTRRFVGKYSPRPFPSEQIRSLERESRHELQLTHAGEGSSEDIRDLAVARAINAGGAGVGQVGMVEGVLSLYLELHT